MTVVARAPSWAPLMPAVLVIAAALWLLRDTGQAMVSVWSRSDTFMHGFLVPPIAMWLVWQRRELLARLPWRPVPWMLLPMALVCLAWLIGQLATVGAVSQFALVAIIVLLVPTLFGWAVAKALMFPLAFLFFAVPFGEFAVPRLMVWTADFTVFALRMAGIPVYREGLEFVIPSGSWSVVEACSGVRYLIASFMVGTLYAYLSYRSMRKRLVFIAASLLVPVLANWVRAFLIVLIGHMSGNKLAGGVDHLIYGWVFFGLVIGAMFLIGARWADTHLSDGDDDRRLDANPATGSVQRLASMALPWTVALGATGLLLASQVWASHLDRARIGTSVRVALPTAADGWNQGAETPMPWAPGYRQASATMEGTYRQNASEKPIWLWVGYYQQPGGQGKLVSSTNTVEPSDGKSWAAYDAGVRAGQGGLPAFRTETLRRGGALDAGSAGRVRVWTAYWLAGRWMVSDAQAKGQQVIQRLTQGHGDGAVIMLATPLDAQADAVIESFLRTHAKAIDASLAAATSKP